MYSCPGRYQYGVFEGKIGIAYEIGQSHSKGESRKAIALQKMMVIGGYEAARGGTQTLDFLEATIKDRKLVSQRISTEFHHAIISQRVQRAYDLPNWLVNNRLNVWKLNTVQHAIIDAHRFQFLRFSIKSEVGMFGEYNWFTKFPLKKP